METGIIEGVTEVIESKTEAICDRSALPDGTALENGRYEIRTTLGNGGFGITYKAWDYRLQRFVAIKEFFPDGFAYRDAGRAGRCAAFRTRRPSSTEASLPEGGAAAGKAGLFPHRPSA